MARNEQVSVEDVDRHYSKAHERKYTPAPRPTTTNTGHTSGPTHSTSSSSSNIDVDGKQALRAIALVFMIISCIGFVWMVVPAFWMIPMTLYYGSCVKKKYEVGFGFKIATLFLVNPISGILMLIGG
ncbi:MAG: hypothetical protein K6C32_03725 [Bacilli bacterium]|nr:hypothetical protein [Bacilli bacterium]